MTSVYITKATLSFGVDTNNENVAITLFFSGCSKEPHCEDCHNKSLWDRDESLEQTVEALMPLIRNMLSPIVTAVVFVGGEPLDQEEAVLEMAKEFVELGLECWLYTGRKSISTKIVDTFDVIVSGPYDNSLKTGGFPASSNQYVLRK